ncbi:Poly(A) polymerase pla1 [Pseudomassariella vexata]|uniref:Poly(A) polymerase n=1 Tax=Pseudomassariella vexata TaxID=1141098 RepID=A0A1Y2EEB2_9PEZI|nr:Poly(A) polymerase pla1 [Pseudomassariella vexata]ORY69909.1 Poly(A) polymerase pla1 [Pseudomassariella vexata]
MAYSGRQWGTTPPISTALPTQVEVEASDALFEELKRQGTFESKLETDKRHKVLTDLRRLVDEFVRRIAREKEPHNTVLIRDARGEVFTYGSFCLGVYGPGSDIDTLVVAPRYVTREDYFKHFPGMLKEMTPKGAVTDLTPVEDAFVPIIKFEYWGISIDLIFSRIATLKQFPAHGELKLTNNEYLRGLDEAELRSLNGTRVTNEILNLVPEQSTFRLALRAIKLWAQRRAIYANIIGFPGGVVWAMLVARICQLYPRAASATIVAKFFFIISKWKWPQPVMLKAMEENAPLSVRVWNPKVYKGDGYHLMPVITPAYPEMCATFNITHSNKAVIQRELERGNGIADKIVSGAVPWKALFVKHTFFTQGYKYYLAVIVTSKEKEAHKIWSGFVESKVRVLVANLERHPSIAIAHPFNKGFERRHTVKCGQEFEAILDGSLAYIVKGEDEEGTVIKDELPDAAKDDEEPKPKIEDGTVVQSATAAHHVESTASLKDRVSSPNVKPEAEEKPVKMEDLSIKESKVYTTTHYIGLELAEGAKSLDLSFQVNEYKDLCHAWDKYDSKLNFLSVQHVKNINLPEDVFEPGEAKPTRPLKKPGGPNGALAQRKRPAPSDVRLLE